METVLSYNSYAHNAPLYNSYNTFEKDYTNYSNHLTHNNKYNTTIHSNINNNDNNSNNSNTNNNYNDALTRNDYPVKVNESFQQKNVISTNQQPDRELDDNVFEDNSAEINRNHNKPISNSHFQTLKTSLFPKTNFKNTTNRPPSHIQDYFSSITGKEDSESKSSSNNASIVGSVQEELDMMRVSLSEEIGDECGSSGGFNKYFRHNNDYKGSMSGNSDDKSSGEGNSTSSSPAYSKRRTLSIQEYEETSSKNIFHEKEFTKNQVMNKSLSTSTSPKKSFKPVLVPPHVDNTTGLPRFVTSIDLSGFRLSVSKVDVFVDPLSNRRLVVEAVERASKGEVTKRFQQKINLPRFADVYAIKHRVNVMGVLKIEIPLLYYSDKISLMKEDEANRTNIHVLHTNKRTNINDVRSGGSNMEIDVNAAEGVKIENIRIKIQDNIIVICEINVGDNHKNVRSKSERFNLNSDEYDAINDIKRNDRISDSRDVRSRNINETPNKVRLIRLFRVPEEAMKEKIRCQKISNGSLKIIVPMRGH